MSCGHVKWTELAKNRATVCLVIVESDLDRLNVQTWCYGELVNSVVCTPRLSVGWKHSRTRLHGVISKKPGYRQENRILCCRFQNCSGFKHTKARSDK